MQIFPDRPQPGERTRRIIGSVCYLVAGVLLAGVIVRWFMEAPASPNVQPSLPVHGLIAIGIIGGWRYSWWILNFIRAHVYGKRVFPRLRAQATACWEAGARPEYVHFLLTTYHEREEVTSRVLDALQREISACGVRATVWMALGHPDDAVMVDAWQRTRPEAVFNLIPVGETQPGKRGALGALLRAVQEGGGRPGDLLCLMDGDTVLGEGSLMPVLSCFLADTTLQAVTTNEEPYVDGPLWVREWYNLRFAQRRLWMQSHSLSHRVITLTGRFSAFRASAVLRNDFIETVEEDYLNHWLWGRFRFLSGDDKSTWYCLLKQGGKMLYIPDAMVLTLERIDGDPWRRVQDNMLRWSGNMLRNGMRALDLGPRAMPLYIWWCLVDQRLAIWTVPSGITMAVLLSISEYSGFLWAFFAWVLCTRAIVSIALCSFGGTFHIAFPVLLYFNQVATSFVKIYMLFRLPQQAWANRHGVLKVRPLAAYPFRLWMARYLTIFYLCLMVVLVCWISGMRFA